MILPIVPYGDSVLRKKSETILDNYENLQTFIEDMFETMDNARGVGLAAPQVGRAVRVFVVDGSPFAQDEQYADQAQSLKNSRLAFINPVIIEESGTPWDFNEGCLSIPEVRGNVSRMPVLKLKYRDLNFVEHTETFDGLVARIIQHEYDHIEGILFTDRLSPLRRRTIESKLNAISRGDFKANYPMRFSNRNEKK